MHRQSKTLHLIRHAESLHNEKVAGVPEHEQQDPYAWDADLSVTGAKQVHLRPLSFPSSTISFLRCPFST